MSIIKALLFMLIFLPASLCNAQTINYQESGEIQKIFSSAGVSGTFILYDVREDSFIGYNLPRAQTRYIPASTFKIPNSIIMLSLGIVKDVDEIIHFEKPEIISPAWNKDMSLREAIKVSNLPLYQHLARQVDLNTMQEQVEKFAYGNSKVGKTIDNFWLCGPLEISAVEQCEFLAKLAQKKLPLAKKVQETVAEITVVEKNSAWTLHAKTGVADAYSPYLGWYVGWLEKDGRLYTFALNMDLPDPEADYPKRGQLSRSSLAALGLIDK